MQSGVSSGDKFYLFTHSLCSCFICKTDSYRVHGAYISMKLSFVDDVILHKLWTCYGVDLLYTDNFVRMSWQLFANQVIGHRSMMTSADVIN